MQSARRPWLERLPDAWCWRRRTYGISWTSSLPAAEKFAGDYRAWPGGSVVLETVAPPEAIICAITYPTPLTEAEKAELPPDVEIDAYHEECEHLVDRRLLGPIKVLRRYPEADDVCSEHEIASHPSRT